MTLRCLILCLSLIAFSCSKEELLENDSGLNKSLTATEQENKLFNLLNEHRLSLNLSSLTFDNLSYSFASEHSEYMISQGVTSHVKFNERAAEISAETGAEFVAENVANDYFTIEDAMKAWLESPGHKENIEGDYSHSAISVKKDPNGNLYFTQIFYR
ncbi:MAG: CAP domain-containing protein [Maribacter sp.]|nr:CAP domain-containing protein [Maribacter sp.]